MAQERGEPGGLSERAKGPVADALRTLRAKARAQLIIQRFALIAASTAGVACALGYLDFALRFPAPVRWGFWIFGIAALCAAVFRRLLPAIRFKPTLTEVALRVEGAAPGGKLAGVLASGVELGTAEATTDLSRTLAGIASAEATARFNDFPPTSALLRPAVLARALGAAILAAAPIIGTAWLAPEHARIGGSRVLTPWAAASWPKRTGVIDASTPKAHPAGQALPLRALLTKSSRNADETDVRAQFRVIVNGQAGPAQRVLLTSQHRRAKVDSQVGAAPAEGSLFERLVDVSSLLPAGVTMRDKVEVEYSFLTDDDATPARNVLIVEPPAVKSADVTVEPPEYLVGVVASVAHEAGSGRDSRSSLGPVVAGSRVRLKVQLNKPLPGTNGEASDPASFLRGVAPALAEQPDVRVTAQGEQWEISWTAKAGVRAAFDLVDEHGIRSVEESIYRIDVAEDRPATATIVDPPQDESVLATAVIPVTAEGRDDVGLSEIAVNRQLAKRDHGSEGAPAMAVGTPESLAQARPEAAAKDPTRELRASAVVELANLGVVPGDEVWLQGVVKDLLAASQPDSVAVRSPTRRLRVISETTFAEQVQAELSSVRESAKRLASEQTKVAGIRDRALADRQQAREQVPRQDAVAERLAPMVGTVDRLTSRVERNNPEDSSLEQLLSDVKDAAGEASAAAERASDALESLSRREEAEATPEQAAALEAAQQQTEERLDEIVKMLDRGRDGWAARRSLERLITEQRQVSQQTSAAGQESQGKTPEQLSAQQRDDLNRLAQKQQELADRTRAAIENLEAQAQQVKESDPGLAESMKQAAERGRKELVAEKQENAAEQVQQNQTGAAQRQQEQASRALEQMLGELDKAEQRRDEALRRTMADLNEAIQRLIDAQETELAKLEREVRGAAQEALDAGMIAVNRGTAAALDQANALADPGRLPELLESGGNAQGAAVASLRAQPRDLGEADANERRSLARLREALEEGKRLDEETADRQEDRARDELAKVYRGALERQTAINTDTAPLLDKPVGRRERAQLRTIADEQENLRGMLAELRTKTTGMDEAKVFDYAHDRLEESMSKAVSMMRAGTSGRPLGREQAAALRVLGSLVQALDNSEKPSDDLRDEEQGQDGGGGSGGAGGNPPLLPPGTELKLLRMMQQEAMERTRAIGDGTETDASELDAVSLLQQELHRRAKELLDAMQQQSGGPRVEQAPKDEAAKPGENENPGENDKPGANDKPEESP
ncbi:MAG: hypothetical protein ACOYN0_01835 [Phycisphaerales bacterium]